MLTFSCDMVGGIWLPLAVTTAAMVFMGSLMFRHAKPLECCKLHVWIGWAMESLERCRRYYVRSRRPCRIILMRHAESEGNVDKGIYTLTPDHALKITDRGKLQAAVAGSELKKLIGKESVYFIVSPYTRTRMTYEIVREVLGPRDWAMKEDPRLRELDFGNFQDLAAMKETMETRKAYGRFWYRFMNGESGADVYDRATAFWESVFRSMDNRTAGSRFNNYVIVTHGLMMRLILMRYFQWKVEFFERVWNPDNCETWVMERDERGSYRFVTEILDRPGSETASQSSEPAAAQRDDEVVDGSSNSNGNNGESCWRAGESGKAAAAGGGAVSAATRGGSTRDTFIRERQGDATDDGGVGSDGNSTQRRPSSGGIDLVRRLTVELPADPPSPVLRQQSLGEDNGDKSSAEIGDEAAAAAMAAVAALRESFAGAGAEVRGDGCAAANLGVGDVAVKCAMPSVGSALNLSKGGFAPGEEGYGRDEEL